jgi:DNA-binding transcriptional ArsR family regulator
MRRDVLRHFVITHGYQTIPHDIQKREYDCAMDTTDTERQAQIFRALMHPARLAILKALRHDEACVCHLEAQLGYRQAYLSQQLAILREIGLVRDRRDGWNIYYSAAQPAVFTLLDTALRMVDGNADRELPPERIHDCPCPKCAPSVEPVGSP